jgi:hypothetical protein
VKKPTELPFLTQTGAPGTYYHTLFKGTFVLPIHPLNGTCTQSMSPLSQGLKILLQPVSSPSSTLIKVDLTNYINKGL